MDITKQPGISVEKILLFAQSLKRDLELSGKIEYSIETQIGFSVPDDSSEFSVTFELIINGNGSDGGSIELSTTFIGYFSVVCGEENMTKEDFAKSSAAALLFPYIREHIATTTLKAGLPVLQLPITNFIALFSEASEASEVSEA